MGRGMNGTCKTGIVQGLHLGLKDVVPNVQYRTVEVLLEMMNNSWIDKDVVDQLLTEVKLL